MINFFFIQFLHFYFLLNQFVRYNHFKCFTNCLKDLIYHQIINYLKFIILIK